MRIFIASNGCILNRMPVENGCMGGMAHYTKLRELISDKRVVESSNVKILDFGCGSRKYPNSIGLDISKKPGVDIIWNLENTPYPFEDASIDLIICREVLEHLHNPEQFIKEISRILKKKGVLYLTTNNRKSLINRLFKTYENLSHCSLQTTNSLQKLVSKELCIIKFFFLPYSNQDRNDLRYIMLRPFRIFLHYMLPKSLQERMVVIASKK